VRDYTARRISFAGEERDDAVLVLGCEASRQRRSAQVAIDQQRTVTASRGEQGKIVG
jgi:hypothetical protein